jgi:hypothetical protein
MASSLNLNLNLIAADITKWIHIFMILFVLVGHSVSPVKYLKYYIFFVLFILLDWNDIDGMCILTKLENYFRTGKWVSLSPLEGGPEFFRPLINGIFSLNLNRTEADRLNNFMFVLCIIIAFYRIVS